MEPSRLLTVHVIDLVLNPVAQQTILEILEQGGTLISKIHVFLFGWPCPRQLGSSLGDVYGDWHIGFSSTAGSFSHPGSRCVAVTVGISFRPHNRSPSCATNCDGHNRLASIHLSIRHGRVSSTFASSFPPFFGRRGSIERQTSFPLVGNCSNPSIHLQAT